MFLHNMIRIKRIQLRGNINIVVDIHGWFHEDDEDDEDDTNSPILGSSMYN